MLVNLIEISNRIKTILRSTSHPHIDTKWPSSRCTAPKPIAPSCIVVSLNETKNYKTPGFVPTVASKFARSMKPSRSNANKYWILGVLMVGGRRVKTGSIQNKQSRASSR